MYKRQRDYLNQWHRETQDFYGRNRTSGDDLINIMRSNLTKLLAAQSTFERLDRMKSRMLQQMMDGDTQELEEVDQLGKNAKQFAEQSDDFKQIQEEFKEYMKFLQGDINKKAKEYGYIEYFDASLRDGMAKKIVDANDNVALLDDRRRPLASINPFYAFASNMPPAPAVEECVEEYMSLDIARVATDSLQEIAENSQEATLDHHAELVDDSDAMEYSVYAPQHMEEAEKTIRMSPDVEAAKPEMSETSEEAEVPKESETPVVSGAPVVSEVPVASEAPVIPETPATPEVSDEMDDLSGLDDLDDLSDLDDLDDLSDLEKDK